MMDNTPEPDDKGNDGKEYKRFAAKRIVAGILITVLVIWMASLFFGFFDKGPRLTSDGTGSERQVATTDSGRDGKTAAHAPAAGEEIDRYKGLFQRKLADAGGHLPAAGPAQPQGRPAPAGKGHGPEQVDSGAKTPPAQSEHATAVAELSHGTAADGGHAPAPAAPHTAAPAAGESHPAPAAEASHAQAPAPASQVAAGHEAAPAAGLKQAPGVAFVLAMIKPLDYELNERFWGWRPNDIIDLTDNVNNFQLGVLEVTRRTTIVLTERISRIGSAASFDEDMEHAMNWFMIQPTRYMLPSPEDKYNEGLDDLRQYADKLKKGLARFFTRTDNLIPLLSVYQDLLGSCDENLVKVKEDNGKRVSTFKADDYFFYAKGVSSAMMGILEAVIEDFDAVLESRKAREALHHAVETLHHATQIDPWIILNSDLSSIFANHRANMAAPISHARFYLSVAIGALST